MNQILLDRRIYLYSLGYYLLLALGHWGIRPGLGTIVFGIGAFIGLHLLPALELALNMQPTENAPSPLRNMLTILLVFFVTVFIVTTSQTNLGSGVVLFLTFRYILLAWEDYKFKGNLSSWLPEVPMDKHYTLLVAATVILGAFSVIYILV